MQVGDIWNGWKVEKFIGEGSFGQVYSIVREEFGHRYESALKVICIPQNLSEYETIRNEGMSEASVTEYFRSMVEDIVEEFSLMAKLKGNTNIVSYEDHAVVPMQDRFGWEIFIRMEKLTPLYKYLKGHNFTIRQVIQLGIDMCQALEVCQRFNIIHRDIKPENIFVSELGKFKLGDFGIAKQLDKTVSSMSKKGTYTYMAPEVYKGMKYNSTVDIYSLGIVLYRFLNNNRTPFLPPFPQTIKYSDKERANVMRMSGEPMPKPCNAQGRLAEIILKACAYRPEDRYDSAVEFKKALQSVLYNEAEANIIYPQGDELKNNNYSTYKSISSKPGAIQGKAENKTDNRSKVKQNDKQKQKPAKQEKKKNLIVPIAVGLVLVVVIAVAAVMFVNSSGETTVPSFVNLTQDKAEQISKENSLSINITGSKFSDKVKKGGVISQSVKKGETVSKGTSVDLVLSKGKEIKIPDLTNKSKANVISVLNKEGLKLNVSKTEFSDNVAKNSVISQNPVAGTSSEEGGVVSVVLSNGVEKITVPNVVGKTSAKAKKLLTDSGMSYTINKAYSSKYKKGKVSKQSLKAGKKVNKHTAMMITISKGAEPKPKNNSSLNSEAESYVSEIARSLSSASRIITPKSGTSKKSQSKGSLFDIDIG
jgi:beta-lactam-binding protein with PASTA domain